jgi:hypothetical protein
MAPRAVYSQFNTVRYHQCLCSSLCDFQCMYLLIPMYKTQTNAYFTLPGFRPAGSFLLSPYKVVKLITSIRLFTQPGLDTGREFTGRLPDKNRSRSLLYPFAARQLNHSGASAAQRHVHTHWFLAGCSRAITFHCSFSRVLFFPPP